MQNYRQVGGWGQWLQLGRRRVAGDKPVGVHAFMDQTSMIFGRDTKVALEGRPKARWVGPQCAKVFTIISKENNASRINTTEPPKYMATHSADL